MANYYTNFSVMFDPGAENVKAAIELAEQMREDPEAFELQFFGARIEEQDGKIWIEDDTSSDTEGVITFVLECAKRFGLKGRWGFEYANTCDKPRLEAYGGGVIVVDFDAGKFESVNTNQIYDALIKNQCINI